MININKIATTDLNFIDSTGLKLYYNNLGYELIWERITLHFDLMTPATKIYFEGVPLQKSKKILKKEFYENGNPSAEYSIIDGELRSPCDDYPAATEWSIDGTMALEIYNSDLDTEVILSYD